MPTPLSALRKSWDAAGALLARRVRAGGRCAVCRGWCEGGLCRWCEDRFATRAARCPLCAIALPSGAPAAQACLRCILVPPAWSSATAGVDYAYPWSGLLAEFKFLERPERADVLLQPLLARLGKQPPPADLRLVPVPLAGERLRERGYNQSWELARRLARAWSLQARPDALFRVRDTAHQLALHRTERDANLRGAFVVTPARAAWVRGARIALIDDVLTTGATASAATRVLRAAGAAEVRVWVVARTPST